MRYSRNLTNKPVRKRKYAGFIVLVILLGVAAYFIGAGAAGEWLAQNLINPVFNSGDTNADETNDPAASSVTDEISEAEPGSIQSVSLPESSGSQTEDTITAKELSLYALQVGAFSAESNAKEAASELVSKGGAGFVAFDGSYYRVLIAAYTTEDDAADVKSSLYEQNVKTTIFNLKSGTLDFKIGAEQTQINAIKACFDIVPEVVVALQDIIYAADKGENVDDDIVSLQQSVGVVLEELEAAVPADSGAIQSLNSYMQGFCETINNIPLSSDVSDVEFNSQLKYNLISIVVDYSAFLEELGSQ